jgi:hypothetical protein
MAEENNKELFDAVFDPKEGVPKFPISAEGWAKKLVNDYDVRQIKEILMLHHSGVLTQAVAKALEVREKIPFEMFWEAYAFKKGNKTGTMNQWDKLSYSKQEYIINVALPKYNRFIDVSGISKCQAIVYLRQRRYNDEIPDKDQIAKFAKTVERFFNEYLEWKKKYPIYNPESFDTLFRATEAFMYRFPNMQPIDVCGVLKWMVKTWESQYRHLIKPSRAMNIGKWQGYFTSASYEIEMLKRDAQRRKVTQAERDVNRERPNEEEE